MNPLKSLVLGILSMSAIQPMVSQVPGPLVGVSRINNQNTPLSIIAVTQRVNNMLSSLVLSNTTDRSIVSYEVGWIPIVAPQCADRRSVGAQHIVAVRPESSIGAGARQELTSLTADPSFIVSLGKPHHAVLITVQVAVVSVRFADGTTWQRRPDDDVYDQAIMDEDAQGMCARTVRSYQQ
jgi:hypothetical protein